MKETLRRWSTAETEILRAGYSRGTDVAAIAQTLNRSIPSCKKRASRIGIAAQRDEWNRPRVFLEKVVLPFRGEKCLIWPYGCNGNGFPEMSGMYVGPIVCEAIHGSPPHPDSTVFYECGNGAKKCVNGNHMRWGVPGEGRRGTRNNHVKLTEKLVLWILRQPHTVTVRTIAEIVGITHQQVSRIRRGVTWAWLYREWKAGRR